MSLDVAYSLEIGDFIDPELAYELYWAEVITDKTQFVCPGRNCDAKVTCANLDKERQDMLVSPHYKVYGEHSEECDAFTPLVEYAAETTRDASGGLNQIKGQSSADVFKLKRPESHFKKLDNHNSSAIGSNGSVHIKPGNLERSSEGYSTYFSVRSIVTKFLCYRERGTTKDHFIKLANEQMPYKRAFRGVYNQEIDSLPSHSLVYWGKAFIDRTQADNAYRVKFVNKLKIDGREVNPSFFLGDDLVENYPVRNLVRKRLEKISSEKPNLAYVFVYGRPNKTRNGRYVNFKVENLDYLEIRYSNLLYGSKVKEHS